MKKSGDERYTEWFDITLSLRTAYPDGDMVDLYGPCLHRKSRSAVAKKQLRRCEQKGVFTGWLYWKSNAKWISHACLGNAWALREAGYFRPHRRDTISEKF